MALKMQYDVIEDNEIDNNANAESFRAVRQNNAMESDSIHKTLSCASEYNIQLICNTERISYAATQEGNIRPAEVFN